MAFDLSLWKRYQFDGLPVYLRADPPAWFVPNLAGEQVLQDWAAAGAPPRDLESRRFLARLPDSADAVFPGRGALLTPGQLKELWFHMTNRCNLACSHCLFASCPSASAELTATRILTRAEEAVALGCRLFALTGGEPLVHPEIQRIVDNLLAFADTHVVILTNGLLLREKLPLQRWDPARCHLQISVDGHPQRHDRIRGPGTYARLKEQLTWLQGENVPFTLSMCVDKDNCADMTAVVEEAAATGAANVHFMWYFVRGRGSAGNVAPTEEIFLHLVRAEARAAALGVTIDNLEALKSQIFAPAGTFHDGSSAAWESLAIGPDDRLYPSAALVGVPELATDLHPGLAHAWRSGAVLETIRRTSAVASDAPWRFLLGGGDIDHCYLHAKSFTGTDPYTPLHLRTALWLIADRARRQPADGPPRLRLKMGDVLQACGAHGAVALVHSNCLLAVARPDSLATVKDFYRQGVGDTHEEILNPVCYPDDEIAHIPAEFRFRGYGCGSPVLDAHLQSGETVVDLGCGAGVECFLAARQVGPQGQVMGIDMLDPMLDLARRGAQGVAGNLGYANLEFRKGYLEELPLSDAGADVVLSNCVLNLSLDKRRAFAEIFRTLRPGGRLVVSDVVCETEPDAAIRNDPTLHGECISGALTQKDLIGILEESSFQQIRLLKRFPYRTVQKHPFFSLTFEARKPRPAETAQVIYRGPFAAVQTSDGTLLLPGMRSELSPDCAAALDDQIFVLDDQGGVTNLEMSNGCCCALPPEARETAAAPPPVVTPLKRAAGCMVCGSPLIYRNQEEQVPCSYCQRSLAANARCEKGHFVCDSCHSEDALAVMENICLQSRETDVLALFASIRRHPSIPVNGPEHHALLPAVILTAYRNLGAPLPPSAIATGIRRGAQMIGGSCAYLGVCGAASGVGIAFSLILEATPLKGAQRQRVQTATQQALARIAALAAPRCCHRDGWLALQVAAELSAAWLSVPLRAQALISCRQQHLNAECMGTGCPLQQAGAAQNRPREVQIG